MAFWGEYVSVAERQAKAKRQVTALRKKGLKVEPVEISGTMIASTFWGKNWCKHLESFSDYSNRLPRGRSYVRQGAVCHLAVENGAIFAMVNGTSLYHVDIKVSALPSSTWTALTRKCTGQISSMLELLSGKLSKSVMEVVCDRDEGLFPKPREIKLSCSCPDGARMCKHVAAVLYGVGHRLDSDPELLFLLRGVDPVELLANPVSVNETSGEDSLEESDLASLFGIEMDFEAPSVPAVTSVKKKASKKRVVAVKSKAKATKAKAKAKAKAKVTAKPAKKKASQKRVAAAKTTVKATKAKVTTKAKPAKKKASKKRVSAVTANKRVLSKAKGEP